MHEQQLDLLDVLPRGCGRTSATPPDCLGRYPFGSVCCEYRDFSGYRSTKKAFPSLARARDELVKRLLGNYRVEPNSWFNCHQQEFSGFRSWDVGPKLWTQIRTSSENHVPLWLLLSSSLRKTEKTENRRNSVTARSLWCQMFRKRWPQKDCRFVVRCACVRVYKPRA